MANANGERACVFGGFFYTGCQQKPTNSLRWLAPGSLILFGSHFGRSEQAAFVVDTVFVVRDHVDHNAQVFRTVLERSVPSEYFTTTLEPWYWGESDSPIDLGYRLYRGATREQPIGGMFSFFPAVPSTGQQAGFGRPQIQHQVISNGMSQGYKLTAMTMEGVTRVWRDVREQVLAAGLWLGTAAVMPTQPDLDAMRVG
jgi:hypothetical protein